MTDYVTDGAVLRRTPSYVASAGVLRRIGSPGGGPPVLPFQPSRHSGRFRWEDPADPIVGTLVRAEDHGAKALFGVGSIQAGSAVLTMNTPDHGFEAGDPVAIAVGGEAGAGALGSYGVGGHWPALNVASFPDLPASVGSGRQYAAVDAEGGRVYETTNGGETWRIPDFFYRKRRIPRGLVSSVLSVAGAEITLSDTALVTATGAVVCYDNARIPLLTDLLNNSDETSPVTVLWRAGVFGWVGLRRLDRENMTFRGAGKHSTVFQSLDGLPMARVHFRGGDRIRARDFQIVCNWRHEGFYGYDDDRTSPHEAVSVLSASDSAVQDVIVRDAMKAIAFQNSPRSRGARIHAYAPGNREYMGWQIQLPDMTDGVFEDVCGVFDHFQACFEPFKARRARYRRFWGYNATASNNSSSGTVYDHGLLYFSEGCEDAEAEHGASTAALIQSNLNLANVSGGFGDGGVFRDVVMSQDGAPGPNPNVFALAGIVSTDVGVTVERGAYVPRRSDGSRPPTRGVRIETDQPSSVTGFRTWTAGAPGITDRDTVSGTRVVECVQDVPDSGLDAAGQVVGGQTTTEWLAERDASERPLVDGMRIESRHGHGAIDVFAYDVDAEGGYVPLTRSPWGEIVRVLWQVLDRSSNVVAEHETPYATFRLPPGSYALRQVAWDEAWRTSVAERAVTIPPP